jgi:hypothetical protein
MGISIDNWIVLQTNGSPKTSKGISGGYSPSSDFYNRYKNEMTHKEMQVTSFQQTQLILQPQNIIDKEQVLD